MKSNPGKILLVAVLAMLSAACIGRVRAPIVELTGIRFGGIGLRGATLIAQLNIDNPNDFTIEADSITYEFEASSPGATENWTPVTKGTNTERIRIDEERKTAVEVPIELSYSGLSGPVRSIMDKGTFNYRVRGQVFLREPLRRTVPFSEKGNLSFVGAR
jgi:LEA14-like dessication related protein